jgi:23S rRNA (guanosine2251-2'-O)-methyltransferase
MSRLIYGKHAVLERLSQDNPGLEYVVLAKGMKSSDGQHLEKRAKAKNIRVQWKDRGWLNDAFGHDKHQGVAASTGDFEYRELIDLIQSCGPQGTLVAVDSVEDPGNLGAILRSAECSGCSGIILPKDRSAQVNATAEKTSAGASSHLPVAQVVNLSRALEDLKKAGFWIYGLAGEAKQSLYDQKFDGKVCIVLGGEGKGMRDLVTKHCDVLLKIPMSGKIESLNVSVAAGVTLFEVRRSRGSKP